MLACGVPHDSLRHGDLVEVRGAADILATLDSNSMLDGLPFMPEMVRFCGRQLVVDKRASKICDTIYPLGTRSLPDTVLLGSLRCDGSGHDGCQLDCRLYWKEAWVRRVRPGEPSSPEPKDSAARAALSELASNNIKVRNTDSDATVTRYVCQATELHRASHRLSTWDPRPYVREYTSGNVGLGRFLKVVARAAVEEPMRKLRISPRVFVRGPGNAVREPALNLQPGDLVQIKSREEIVATLGPDGRNRGLFFDREMLPFCGGTFRVKQRVTRFIDDRSGGRMLVMKSDCVTLEGVVCSGDLSPVRWLCPRQIHSFWREAWLRRVAPGEPDLSARQAGGQEHHPGTTQVDAAEI
jgi:hypothetical protein